MNNHWNVFNKKIAYDGKHPKVRFSVSTGVKIENFMRVKTKNDTKRGIEEFHIKYFISKFAFKLYKRSSIAIIN